MESTTMRSKTKMKPRRYKALFVEDIPITSKLRQGILYVSIKHSIVTHLCACGCGTRIDTPLDPDEWTMIYNGETISLRPSIGNWDIPCQSHYFITGNTAVPVKPSHKEKKCRRFWFKRIVKSKRRSCSATKYSHSPIEQEEPLY